MLNSKIVHYILMSVTTGFMLGAAFFIDRKVAPAIEAYRAEVETRQTLRKIQTYLLVRQAPALRGCTTWDEEDWQEFQKKMEDH